MSTTPSAELQELARSYGVQLEYRDMAGQIQATSSETLLTILQVLGAEVQNEANAPEALRKRRLQAWKRVVDPVVVLWQEDGDGSVEFRVPENPEIEEFDCVLVSEGKETRRWKVKFEQPTRVEFEGDWYVLVRVSMPPDLATGYHQLHAQQLEANFHAWTQIIRAPRKSYERPIEGSKRPWGVFCPLYALHRDSSWGAGDFSDLEALIDWTAEQGGELVATLPMLASNFDGPEPVISPYSPTSRLFWNEFYLDLKRIPELLECPAALAMLEAEASGREVEAMQSDGMVDYGTQMRLKRAVLEVLAEWFFFNRATNDESFQRFRSEHPLAEEYAEFQANGEQLGRDWRKWSAIESGLVDSARKERAYRYHLYSQWKADEQLQALALKSRRHGLTWYLDFPIGVDHNSFDVWKNLDIFATGASVGCPPDPVFTKGQNWGFPPVHPDRQRESGYTYLIESIRSHLRYANALRIDHVMGLHRLFWIPNGAEARDGAFVSTPSEEIYAILSVESHRHQAWLVGEDLGTVPPEVETAMRQHNVLGMFVVQYEIRTDQDRPLRPVPSSTIASLNTHDMPPFAAFWQGIDLDDRLELGLLDGNRLEAERQIRDQQRRALIRFLQAEGRLSEGADLNQILPAIHEWLAASPASVLLLNLEDLWLETMPQNTPNTYRERPNWRRKLARNFEEFSDDPAILAMLERVNRLRSNPPA